MMFGYGSHWAFWQVGLMWVGMVAFWGFLIWAIYSLIGTSRRPENTHRCDEARHTLDQRLARGEIDAEEYRQRLDLIVHGAAAPVGAGDRR